MRAYWYKKKKNKKLNILPINICIFFKRLDRKKLIFRMFLNTEKTFEKSIQHKHIVLYDI